jgi:hypothetical protein
MTIPTTTLRPISTAPATSFASRLSPAQTAPFTGVGVSLEYLQRSAARPSFATSFGTFGIEPFRLPAVAVPAMSTASTTPLSPQALLDRLVAAARAASGTGTLTPAQMTAVMNHYNQVTSAARTAQHQAALSIVQRMKA